MPAVAVNPRLGIYSFLSCQTAGTCSVLTSKGGTVPELLMAHTGAPARLATTNRSSISIHIKEAFGHFWWNLKKLLLI